MKNNTCLKEAGQDQIAFDGRSVVVRSCLCRSVWCPTCYTRYHSKAHIERLRLLDWRCIRTIMISIDPNKYPDPKKAFLEIRKTKAIPELLHNLERTCGVNVRDWCRFIEFHRNGYPHWHIYVDVGKAGAAGRITGDILRHYWRYGRVTEGFVHNEKHWNVTTGYFEKHGYFDRDKAHQVILPEWAEKDMKIKRFDSKRIQCAWPQISQEEKDRAKEKKQMVNFIDDEERKEIHDMLHAEGCFVSLDEITNDKPVFSYLASIEKCGKRCEVSEYAAMMQGDNLFMGALPKISYSSSQPYKRVKRKLAELGGRFIKGRGFSIFITPDIESKLEMIFNPPREPSEPTSFDYDPGYPCSWNVDNILIFERKKLFS